MSLSIIVPLYNEAASVAFLKTKLDETIRRLSPRHAVELVLVDDGSRDETYPLLIQHFSTYDAKILRHPANCGVGAALRTGFQAATGELLCTMDGDCTYDPLQFPDMLHVLEATQADIITGSPYHPDGHVENVKFWRLLLSLGLSRLYSLMLPYRLHTYTSFFRIYRRRVVEAVPFQSDGFLSVTELLVMAVRMGYKAVEFPTTLRSRQYGYSKIKIFRVMRSHLGFMVRVMAPRMPETVPAPAKPLRAQPVAVPMPIRQPTAGPVAPEPVSAATSNGSGDSKPSTAPPLVA